MTVNLLFFQIITAWSKARDPRSPQKAEELLTLMEELFAEDAKQGLNSQLAPQSQTYTVSYKSFFLCYHLTNFIESFTDT